MKLQQTIIFLLSASLAHAQILGLPSCSLQCFLDSMSHDGCSSLADFACHCRSPGIINEVAPCVAQSCNLRDQSSVSNAVTSQCSSAGVSISIPSPGGDSITEITPSTSDETTEPTKGSTPTPSGPVITLPTTSPSTPFVSSSSVPSSSNPVEPSNQASSTLASPSFDGGAGNLNSGHKLVGAAVAVAAGYLL